MKIAIITDSNSGIPKEEASSLGIYVIAMPFTIQNELYYEDISLSQEDFYVKLEQGDDISTSQPAVGSILDLWDELLKEYEEIIHIPMSSGLSGSCETAMMLAKNYDGKVQVVNNHRISVTQRQSVLDAIALKNSGKTALEIKEILEQIKMDSSIYITVDTLKYLKKGGRITPAAALIGTALNLKPVLQIQGEKLDAFSKCRGLKQAKKIMIQAVTHDLEHGFADSYQNKEIRLHIAHTRNVSAASDLKMELESLFPGIPLCIYPLSLSVACHIGPGALAIACTKNLDVSYIS